MKTVDARGMTCPKPLILTKKALNELAAGGRMAVLIDNETSKRNVERFCRDNGVDVSAARNGSTFTLTLVKKQGKTIRADEKAYCKPEERRRPHVIVFRGDTMGNGPEELGAILMKAFVNTIGEVSPLPSHLLFYNTGVRLVVEGSPLVEPLSELAKKGIKILVCGTCLDYFGLKKKAKVGEVSNMYSILDALSNAGSVIAP